MEVKRYNPDLKIGLTNDQVTERINNNLVNYDDQPKTKTIKQIIRDNFFTYFNFLNIALGLAVFLSGVLNNQILNGLKNCLFMGVIIINSIISIIEEIISKKIIDKLSFINESEIIVIRDGKEEVAVVATNSFNFSAALLERNSSKNSSSVLAATKIRMTIIFA